MAYGDRFGGRDGGRGGFGGGGFRGDMGPREMHKATCSDCGKECEVPFKPGKNADGTARPVYCKECYQNHKKPRDY